MTTPRAADGKDREGDLSIDLEWTTRILTDFIANELQRTGFRRLIIGLSGGIDSALSAMLAARAIGPEAVLGVRLPYRSSSPESLVDAQALAVKAGIRIETVDISAMVDSVAQAAGEITPLRLGNVMARMRMIVLFDRSARDAALVLGSSNKSEILLGYGTLYGDVAAAINPLGDLYKTQVRALAEHLGVPESILRKSPSADLWPDQSDEDELGVTYDVADRVLALLVDARLERDEVVARGFDAETVDHVRNLVMRSHFKRQPTVIARLSDRSVASDLS